MKSRLFLSLLFSLTTFSATQAGELSSLPTLKRQGNATQLLVDGKPFLIRGGELGNSSGEPDYLRKFWPGLTSLNLNTLLVPIYWDVIEPAEGKFDFSIVDGLMRDAHTHKLRLVLLWFGSWKNSMSCYAPAWVKRDSERFPRGVAMNRTPQEILSPFSPANRDTDAHAFGALMRHLREADTQHAVVMVQVENEIGMLPDARDQSEAANEEFASAVPAQLLKCLREHKQSLSPELRTAWSANGSKVNGSWTDVFGPGGATEEIFMAWHFAKYTEAVAAAGKAEYPLPMYVNAALIRPGYKPGQYPSAGPLPHLFDIWRAAAPSIDFLAPDIYFPTFVEWTGRYARDNNPLFIPEALNAPDAAAKALYAIAQHNAIGFCPFAIESLPASSAAVVRDSFGLLQQLEPLILEHQGRGTMTGLLPTDDPANKQPQQIRLGGYVLNATFERGSPAASAGSATAPNSPAGGLVINLGKDQFLFAGTGFTVTFSSTTPGSVAGILNVEEGLFAKGKWQHIRWLNGDQTHQGRHVRIEPERFGIQRVNLYKYR